MLDKVGNTQSLLDLNGNGRIISLISPDGDLVAMFVIKIPVEGIKGEDKFFIYDRKWRSENSRPTDDDSGRNSPCCYKLFSFCSRTFFPTAPAIWSMRRPFLKNMKVGTPRILKNEAIC